MVLCNKGYVLFYNLLLDSVPPMISGCPENITKSVYSLADGVEVDWAEPEAVDNSGQITTTRKTHRPGSKFQLRSTVVTYQFVDPSDNVADCSFSVKVVLLG